MFSFSQRLGVLSDHMEFSNVNLKANFKLDNNPIIIISLELDTGRVELIF